MNLKKKIPWDPYKGNRTMSEDITFILDPQGGQEPKSFYELGFLDPKLGTLYSEKKIYWR